jgi:hypothetical protein
VVAIDDRVDRVDVDGGSHGGSILCLVVLETC